MSCISFKLVKGKLFIFTAFLAFSSCLNSVVSAQNTNDILNLLVSGKTISEDQADSLRAEYAIKQQANLPDKKFQIDAEYRIRTEYRDGYQQMRNDTTSAAFFTGQRSRINLSYTNSNRFSSMLSIQDVRVWGQQDPRSSTASTLQVFEAWVEPRITPDLSVRLGRQRLVYDNQRLFSDNNWRTASVSYDAACIKFNNDKIASDLVIAYNQNSERVRGSEYTPTGFTSFKFLLMHYFRTRIVANTTLTLINAADGFEPAANENIKLRYTNGGRLEWENGNFYATVASWYQWGKLTNGKTIKAWYAQPEFKLSNAGKFQFRLGAEFFSGNETGSASDADNSFVPLFGSGHAFNGSLDLFTKFPADVAGYGFVNPYLFINYALSSKLDLRADFHYFATLETPVISETSLNKYLGFENDLLLVWKPGSTTRIETGISYASLTEDCEKLKKAQSGSHELTPLFFYVAFTFKPVLFTHIFK